MYIHNDINRIKSDCSRSFGDFQNEYVIAETNVNVIYHKENCEQIYLLNADDIINHGIQQFDNTFGKKICR